MTNVINMTALMTERRERELRAKHGIEAGQSMLPLAFLVERVIDRAKRQMTERRNREASGQ